MTHFWFGIEPSQLCDQHLLGEHNELHKFAGWLKTGKSIDGWIENNCVQLHDLEERHEKVAEEMKDRGMDHNEGFEVNFNKSNYKKHLNFDIDRELNRKMLKNKCEDCLS